jgi:subtilase family serine protease
MFRKWWQRLEDRPESQSRTSRPRRRRPTVEGLEDRTLLNVGPIPPSINPADASQTLFGPGATRMVFPVQPPGGAGQFFKFALDGTAPVGPTRFDFEPAGTGLTSDVALALYDADGNQLAVANSADATPQNESLFAQVQPRRVYELGVFFDQAGTAGPYQLTVTPTPQMMNAPLVIDPGTGTAHRQADAGEDSFNAPGDVDYYPLDLTNAGPGGTVTVTPLGLDVRVAASLFRRAGPDEPWQEIATAVDTSNATVGSPVSLPVSPPAGRSLTDGEYALAVAPRGFATAASAYQIDVSATPLLGPATLTATEVAAATNLSMLPPDTVGVAQVKAASQLTGGTDAGLFRFRPAAGGTATLTVTTTNFDPLLSVFDTSGTLLKVASRTGPGELTLSLLASASSEYLVRIADVGKDEGGAYAFAARTPYAANPVTLAAGVTALGTVDVGPNQGGKFFRLTPAPGTDVLVVEVKPTGPGAVKPLAVLLGPNLASETHTAVNPGDTLFFAVNVLGKAGPIDLYVTGLSAGSVSVRVGQLTLPREIDPDSLAGGKLDLQGHVNAADGSPLPVQPAPAAFGGFTGVKYYQLLADPGQLTTWAAQGDGGARPLLAHYVEQGGLLKLAAFQPPDATGQAQVQEEFAPAKLHGVAAFALGFGGTGSVQLTGTAPVPLAVGVGMAPEPPPDLSHKADKDQDGKVDEPDPRASVPDVSGDFHSVLKIRNVTLEADYQQHLWKTILPFNLLEVPKVTFTPDTPNGGLSARVTVYRLNPDGSITGPLYDQTNAPGQPTSLALNVPVSQLDQLRGQTLVFRVEPVENYLGDGIYTLEMGVQTDDPHPFEVFEESWAYPGQDPPDADPDTDGKQPPDGVFPAGVQVVDVIQNQFGYGRAEGKFTSKAVPLTNGSIDVYRFWAVTPGPVTVRTVAVPDPLHPDAPPVNTNLRVYKAHFDGETIDYLRMVPETVPSFDWFPADRSEIDAQTYVNNFDFLRYAAGQGSTTSQSYDTGGSMYFVVVKNQEGSKGTYRIEVDAPTFPSLGGVGPVSSYQDAVKGRTAYLSPGSGGPVTLSLGYVASITQFVGYFPVQLPDHHDGTLTVASANAPAGQLWDFDAFDAAGNPLPGGDQDITGGIAGEHTFGSFTIPDGGQTVYLRVKERGTHANTFAQLTVAADLKPQRPGFTPPPATLPASVPTAEMLLTNPLGDGTAGGLLFNAGEVRTFSFQAAAGPLTVQVKPANFDSLRLLWGVYADRDGDGDLDLLTWDQTLPSAFDNTEPGSTTVLLPLPRQPNDQVRQQLDPYHKDQFLTLPPPAALDYAYDRAPYHDVVVWVKALNTPTAGGGYSVTVDSAGVLPMRNQDLRMDPLSLHANGQATVDGRDWVRLVVPDDISGPVQVDATPSVAGTHFVRYDLYDAATEAFLESGTAVATGGSPAHFTLSQAAGGASYYLRVGIPDAAAAKVDLAVSTDLPKVFTLWDAQPDAKPSAELLDLNPHRADPAPDGVYVNHGFNSNPRPVTFWVGQGGVASFHAAMANTPFSWLALYHVYSTSDNENTPVAFHLELVDYTNSVNVQFGINYNLTAYLDPGLYALMASENIDHYTYDLYLPEYATEEIVLDPNFGYNDVGSMWAVDVAPNSAALDPLIESFRSRFYHVTAPAGSLAGLDANLYSLSDGDLPEDGTASLSVWHRDGPGNAFHQLKDPVDKHEVVDPPGDTEGAVVVADAPPFHEFWLGLHRNHLANELAVSATFVVPVSGTPDLVVEPLVLSPNDGETRVDVKVLNVGYAPALKNTYRFAYSDTSKSPAHLTTSEETEHTLGPFGSRSRTFPWIPARPADEVSYATDVHELVEELDEGNNDDKVPLSTVDAHRPTVTMQLADPALDGNPAPGVWGRYIAGVPGTNTNILFTLQDKDDAPDTDQDGHTDLLDGTIGHANGLTFFLGPDKNQSLPVDFSALAPTAANNPNLFTTVVRDRYGLLSDELSRTVQVVEMPQWLDNADSSLTFDAANHRYDLDFRVALIDKKGTFNDLLPFDVPLVGDKQNRVLAEAFAHTTASLNPATPISAPVQAHVLVKVVGATVFEQTWTGSAQPSSHFQISTNVQIDPQTVEATLFGVTFALIDYDLFHFETPEIPFLAFGVPGVASINANFQFGIDAKLNAALTLALNSEGVVGLAAPTYAALTTTASAQVAGEVEIFGFDLAELAGAVNFSLGIAYGLSTPTSQFVPFDEFFDHDCLEVNGSLFGTLSAEVLGFEVWSYETPHLTFPIASVPSGSHVTGANFGSSGGSKTSWGAKTAQMNSGPASPEGTETIKGGNALLGPIPLRPHPGLVIEPRSGQALYVQAVDPDPDDGVAQSTLAYAHRQGGSWSDLTPLPQTGYVTNPVVALTHEPLDQVGRPAVAVYQVTSTAGDPAAKTVNEFLTGQDIRSRYFDGTSWEPEQAVLPDDPAGPRHDSDPVIAFSQSANLSQAGRGVLAWVRNTKANPVSDPGVFDRSGNEIMAAVWDRERHTWTAPVALTDDAASDSKPAVFADKKGKLYVVWVHDTGAGDELMYRSYGGPGWGPATILPVMGLPDGGRIGSVAVGSRGGDADDDERLDVLFTYRRTLADKTVESRLYDRAATAAHFADAAPGEVVAEKVNFSNLQAINAPDSKLLVSWEQSDGRTSEVFASSIAPASAGPSTWSQPVRLTSGDGFEVGHALAVDMADNGEPVYQVVYEKRAAPGDTPGGSLDQPVGTPTQGDVGTSSVRMLPELGYLRGLAFTGGDGVLSSLAASGTEAVGEAVVVNRGPVGTVVQIGYLSGPSAANQQEFAAETVYLGPGSTYALKKGFPVLVGSNTYSVQLHAVTSEEQEVVGTQDNQSSASLIGLPDLAVMDVALVNLQPKAGDSVDVRIRVRNVSSEPVGTFTVALSQTDPLFGTAPKGVGKVDVPGLAPNEEVVLMFSWQVPAQGGDFVLLAEADKGQAVKEATEFNNRGQALVRVRPDAALTAPGVTATVLDYSGVNNVQVQAHVSNLGRAGLSNVHVHLLRSLDSGPFQDAGSVVIASLPAGSSTVVSFVTQGLAGLTTVNRYRVVVDPDGEQPDADTSNNVAQTLLLVQGLADLAVGPISLVGVPVQGQPLTVKAVIENQGIATARRVLVEVFAGEPGNGGLLIGKTTIDQLDPLSSKQVAIPVNTGKLVGVQRIVVVVDRLQKVLETTDANNQASVLATFASTKPPPPPGPEHHPAATGVRDVTGLVKLIRGRIRRRKPGHFRQVVTIQNGSGIDLQGALSLVFDGQARKVKLLRGSGLTAHIGKAGSPYLDVLPSGSPGLRNGESVSLIIDWRSPPARTPRYTPRVLAGDGMR